MAGVAKERTASPAPLLHWRPQRQAPFERHIDVADHGVHVLVPAAKIVQHFLGAAAYVPALDIPLALTHADEVEEFSGTQRIMHDVAAGTDPIGADGTRDRHRHTL